MGGAEGRGSYHLLQPVVPESALQSSEGGHRVGTSPSAQPAPCPHTSNQAWLEASWQPSATPAQRPVDQRAEEKLS